MRHYAHSNVCTRYLTSKHYQLRLASCVLCRANKFATCSDCAY